jgi:hypothetical protein
VIVPEPEIVFRYPQKSCQGGLLQHCKKEAACCPAPAAPCAAAPVNGQLSFNMNLQMGGGLSGAGYLGGYPVGYGGLPLLTSGAGGNSQLATLMLLAGLAGSNSSNPDLGALRTLLGRSAPSENGAASAATADLEARIKKLNDRIDEEITQVNQNLARGLRAVTEMQKDIEKIKMVPEVKRRLNQE